MALGHQEVVAALAAAVAGTPSLIGPRPNSPDLFFRDEEIARMAKDPAFLDKARRAIATYAEDRDWEGNVIDWRLAATPLGLDFDSARMSFSRYWRLNNR
jgi:hypothetical protein